MKLLLYFLSGILFLGMLNMPSGYYDFLRMAVFIGTIILFVGEFKNGFIGWMIAFVFIGIIFNPILPLYLYNRTIWVIINLLSGITFFIKGISIITNWFKSILNTKHG